VPRLNYAVDQLEAKATDVRRDIVTALAGPVVFPAGSSLAAADLLTTLFFYEINFKLDDLHWPERDIWHVSSRALTPALHAVMAEVGFFPLRDLLAIGEFDHHLEGYPSSRTPGIEVCGGVAGAGLSVGVGVALASRMDRNPRRVYCVMDDSEIQEGQVWEAAMAAAQFELDNLLLIIDLDGKQADGDIEEIIGLAPLVEKLRTFNWHVLEVDGNNLEQLVEAFNRSRSRRGAPSAILSCTARGHGVSMLEETDPPITAELAAQALEELGTTFDDWRLRIETGSGAQAQGQR
jgi:transketolase